MDVFIEATRLFESDLYNLCEEDKVLVIQAINNCIGDFAVQEPIDLRELRQPPLALDLNEYESSLYILTVAQRLGIILSIDKDPVFGRSTFTLFRVVEYEKADSVYQDIASYLYREISRAPVSAQVTAQSA